jgi:hypothetical protein
MQAHALQMHHALHNPRMPNSRSTPPDISQRQQTRHNTKVQWELTYSCRLAGHPAWVFVLTTAMQKPGFVTVPRTPVAALSNQTDTTQTPYIIESGILWNSLAAARPTQQAQVLQQAQQQQCEDALMLRGTTEHCTRRALCTQESL